MGASARARPRRSNRHAHEILATRMKVITGFMGSGPTPWRSNGARFRHHHRVFDPDQPASDWLATRRSTSSPGSTHRHAWRHNRDMIGDRRRGRCGISAPGLGVRHIFLAASGCSGRAPAHLRQAFDATMRSDEMIAEAEGQSRNPSKVRRRVDKLFVTSRPPTLIRSSTWLASGCR